ncbi:alpha-glucosidase [Liquorilactobacillus vini]|uniref:alpha-glucosidase n=1 Tax=Liquorilactobacillus vini TaxID=238015 RepID=UPI0002E6BA00|nr:alpha-glucosidase [Liquorilactobacillus vini]
MVRADYKNAIIYQIYPKSFMDANHDGIGDLRGIINKLDYLKDLGVNTLWLNPIFVSPQVDNGYDISNYYAIDNKMGTIEEFDQLIKAAHQRKLKLILDLVLNHTSDQHPWFQDAIKNPKSIYREYYLWAKGQNGRLPNNWASFFGGSVWEADPCQPDNYYFHLFDKRMPDLNWKCPEVRQAMVNIAKFWLDHGVDGFRLDAFIHLAKADFSQDFPAHGKKESIIAEPFYANLPQVRTYLREFVHQLRLIKPDLLILGEAASADIDLTAAYTDPQDELCDTVVTFRYFKSLMEHADKRLPSNLQPLPLDFGHLKEVMATWQKHLEGISYLTLYWNNHDLPRILEKVGTNYRSQSTVAKMLATLMYLQRGIPCIYYGEEIGMQNLSYDQIDAVHDEQAKKAWQAAIDQQMSAKKALEMICRSHKMAARGVMQWDASRYGGFSDVKPWNLGQNTAVNVHDELVNNQSVLQYYRRLLKLKKESLFVDGKFTLENTSDDLYVYRRTLKGQTAIVICNLTHQAQQYQLQQSADDILLQNGRITLTQDLITLSAYGSLVIKVD